jgi:hypothetical protein
MHVRAAAVFLLLSACATSPRSADDPLPQGSPDLAIEYYAMRRAGTDDLHRSYAKARAAIRAMSRHSTVTTDAEGAATPSGRWRFLGPGNIGGRTRVVIIDPDDPNVMYAAGVSGGIWKSRSGGQQWTAVGDDLANIAVNAMALHSARSNAARRCLCVGTASSSRATARKPGRSWRQRPAKIFTG